MTVPPPESPSPFENEPPARETEFLSSYHRAVANFDRANTDLIDSACEMVASRVETGDADESIDTAAVSTMLGMRTLLIETLRSNEDDERTADIIKEILATHDAERVDFFNELMGEGHFSYVDPDEIDDLLVSAAETNADSEKFVHSVCDEYAGWLRFDLEMLAEYAMAKYEKKEQIAEYDDSLRIALVDGFYDSLSQRIRNWLEYDPNNADHVRILSKKLAIDAQKIILTNGIRIGGSISIDGCTVVTTGKENIGIPEEMVATGKLYGIAIGPVYVYDKEQSQPVKTHDLGLHLTIAQPTMRNFTGKIAQLRDDLDTGMLTFPIMNKGTHVSAEVIVLN